MSISENSLSLLIRGGHIIDPASRIDTVGDLLVKNGRIETIVPSPPGTPVSDVPGIQASGLIVCPGFIDLHCHLREPGFEDKETIATGALAAAAGGFTTICCMPNTNPPADSQSVVKYIKDRAALSGLCRVLPVGCVSKGRNGEELAEMGELAEAGVVAFSDDGSPVSASTLMRHALEYSRSVGLPVMDHCEDLALSRGGVMNEGRISVLLGLRGIPAAAEESMVARDIALVKLTGGRLHLAHLSTRGSVELVRRAKAEGLPVTAEVTPHHLTMTEEWVAGNGRNGGPFPLDFEAFDTRAKVNPPLRTTADVEALIEGLNNGVIDAIATDHAPHAVVDKVCEFDHAASGISGLETALASLLELVRQGKLDLNTVVMKLTEGPASVLAGSATRSATGSSVLTGPATPTATRSSVLTGSAKRSATQPSVLTGGDTASRLSGFTGWGTLKPGAVADITIFDPDREWIVQPEALLSKGKNTPLIGHQMRGKVMVTIVGGKIVYKDSNWH